MWLVLNEAVLRRTVGSRLVMRGQVAERRNMTLQVRPFDTSEHAATHGAFKLLKFPDAQASARLLDGDEA
ncbi:hypothetical protein GCM10009780_00160 [Actinomadura alba]